MKVRRVDAVDALPELFSAAWAAVDDVVHEYIAVCTKIMVALWATIAAIWAQALARCADYGRRRLFERNGAPVTSLTRDRCVFQRRPV